MHILNKVLIGLLIVTSLVFFFFAARAFQTHKHWRDAVRDHQKALASAVDEKAKALDSDGSSGTMGVRQLEMELQRVTSGRGRIWKNVAHGDPDATNGAVVVMPQQLGAQTVIAPNTQLFVFRQANDRDPGAYLGDFKVTNVNDKQWQIQPTRTLPPPALVRLQESRSPWVLYEKMPTPHPELPPTATDPAAEKANIDQYVAQLCDYQKVFDQHHDWRAAIMDVLAALKTDNQAVADALVKAQKEEQELDSDVDEFAKDLGERQRRCKAVADHRQAVEERLAQVEKTLADIRSRNLATAREIARIQLEAARRIDQRTRGVVQTGQ